MIDRAQSPGTPVAKSAPLDVEPKKIVFGTMKGLLSPGDEQALLDAIEAPLPDDVLASFHVGRLEAPE
jgi:hypothetical protein